MTQMPDEYTLRELMRITEKWERKKQRARERRRGIGLWRILVREPTDAENHLLYERFRNRDDAVEFVKELAMTYPEGTLFFITGKGGVGVSKTFVVNEFGEAVPREVGRWVPRKAVPIEHIQDFDRFKSLEAAAKAMREGYAWPHEITWEGEEE